MAYRDFLGDGGCGAGGCLSAGGAGASGDDLSGGADGSDRSTGTAALSEL